MVVSTCNTHRMSTPRLTTAEFKAECDRRRHEGLIAFGNAFRVIHTLDSDHGAACISDKRLQAHLLPSAEYAERFGLIRVETEHGPYYDVTEATSQAAKGFTEPAYCLNPDKLQDAVKARLILSSSWNPNRNR